MPKQLISIIEIGGYPDFSSLYKSAGFEVSLVKSVRKAQSCMKKQTPNVIVAEFNFQSDFRDRTSNLESLLATLQGKYPDCKIIVLYEKEFQHAFDRLHDQYPIDIALCFPVSHDDMQAALQNFNELE